jgi:glycosyltransferase involved in cell wall biosynthesis
MMPKVLHVSAMPLGTGGTESIIVQVSRLLRHKYSFDLLSGVNTTEDFASRFTQESGGDAHTWQVQRLLDFHAASQFKRIIKEHPCDIVHIHDSRTGFILRPLLKIRKIPSLLTVHLPPYYYQWKRLTKLRRALYAWLEARINFATPTHIVYVAQRNYENALHKKYSRAGQTHLIPNGIELEPYKETANRKQESDPILICVARLTAQKNIPILIEAANILRQQEHKFRLWLVGDGPERTILETMAFDFGLTDIVHFLGNRSDVPSLLNQADIFTLPSSYETRPIAIMEAQAAGLPCVVSDVADHSVLVNHQCGHVFEPDNVHALVNALADLLNHPDQRRHMGYFAQGKAFREYGVDKMIQGYDRVYEMLLQNKTV